MSPVKSGCLVKTPKDPFTPSVCFQKKRKERKERKERAVSSSVCNTGLSLPVSVPYGGDTCLSLPVSVPYGVDTCLSLCLCQWGYWPLSLPVSVPDGGDTCLSFCLCKSLTVGIHASLSACVSPLRWGYMPLSACVSPLRWGYLSAKQNACFALSGRVVACGSRVTDRAS